MIKYNFHNYPSKLTLNHYNKARKKIITYFSKFKKIISIYEFGNVKSPGVSDLDFLFILNENSRELNKKFDFKKIDKDARSLIENGTLIKVNLAVFSKLNYVDTIKAKKVYGKKLLLQKPNNHENYFLLLLSILDWMPERILRLIQTINNKKINVNYVLCLLNSFNYSLKKIEKATNKNVNAKQNIKIVNSLRNNWHKTKNPEKKLIKCLNDSIKLGFKSLVEYEKFLKKKKYINMDYSKLSNTKFKIYKNSYIKFIDYKKQKIQRIIESSVKKNDKKIELCLSSFFLPHFLNLTNKKNFLSKKIKNRFSKKINIKFYLMNSYKIQQDKKLKIMSKNFNFLKRNNFKNGLFRYGQYI